MFAQNFWGNWADLETHYRMKVPHEISLFSQCRLQIWYSVIVLCPESQDRGSSKPLPSARISAPSSQFSLTVGFPAILSVSARQGLSAVTQSPYLPSFVLKSPGQSQLWFTTSSFQHTARRAVLCRPAGTVRTSPQQILCPFMLDAPCIHIHVRQVG